MADYTSTIMVWCYLCNLDFPKNGWCNLNFNTRNIKSDKEWISNTLFNSRNLCFPNFGRHLTFRSELGFNIEIVEIIHIFMLYYFLAPKKVCHIYIELTIICKFSPTWKKKTTFHFKLSKTLLFRNRVIINITFN